MSAPPIQAPAPPDAPQSTPAPTAAQAAASRVRRFAAFLILFAVFGGLVVAVILTRGGDASLEYNAPVALPSTSGLVDQKPLQTARRLASLAATPQEQQYATQAIDAADHEVDLAFATALRDATANEPPPTGPIQKLSQHIQDLQAHIRAEQQRVDEQTKALPTAKDPDNTAQNLEVARAQLALDNDELDDARDEMTRLGGDRRAKIQQALDEHEAILKQEEAGQIKSVTARLESPQSLRTMPGKFTAWFSLRDRRTQLDQAHQDAMADMANLNKKRVLLQKQIADTTAKQEQQEVSTRAEILAGMQQLAGQRKSLVELDKRILDAQQTTTIYASWSKLVAAQQRTMLHRILGVFSALAFVVLLIYSLDVFIHWVFTRKPGDVRRMHNVRLVLTVLVQLAGVIWILLILFGPPNQMSTILGLATAGLTIVLKDFIVSLFGWVALMGKNGMSVGDWVEIDGVAGEVVEISLFRTALLETGNWTDAGHPTGRRVSFMNSFAIEGRYFNFSTTGQWLWDELRVTVPPGETAYHNVDLIRQAVIKETRADTELAETEWKRAGRDLGDADISADPGVEMRPSTSGIEVVVRYVTRAQDRLATRARLYEDVIKILHFDGKKDSNSTPPGSSEQLQPRPTA